MPRSILTLIACCGIFLSIAAPVAAETSTRLVTQPVDEADTVALGGNIRPEATPENDRGAVSDAQVFDHMQLLLNRPATSEAALQTFIAGLNDPGSRFFHHWLTADEFGANFGPSSLDLAIVVAWLKSHRFSVDGVQPNRMFVEFSGTAGAVRRAFSTEIHQLDVSGAMHVANMSDPRIPASLAGIIRGVVSLNDFRPQQEHRARPAYTTSGGYELVVPADLATIYNLTPLSRAGISGQGQTIVVIEDTNVYRTADWTTFRSTFGLSAYTEGTFTQIHPSGIAGSCSNPGVAYGREAEAELDAEWASAAAPSANIELASCADTGTTFGGLIALQNLLNESDPPAIVSISYGECEPYNGAARNAAYSSTYQQAVAMGVSVFVSSGDEGGASCDPNLRFAAHGISVNGFASTPYNVAVGGTDFGDTDTNTVATYWTNTNAGDYGSALSYIPEIPWNSSCASVLLSTAAGFRTPYGVNGFCNSQVGIIYYSTTASGSGGPSGCASGVASVAGVVSGNCKGTPKPAWQSVLGNPTDGVRDLPDVSLFAASGAWGHYYVYCDSDTSDGGSCSGAPINWSGAGGTSFSAPILAAIQSLVNQKQGARQGNPNPVYYAIARAEYGSAGNPGCSASKGNKVGVGCVFHDIEQGDIDVNCSGSNNCYQFVLSRSNSIYARAFGTTTGWDFATGLGSLNAANLVYGWTAGQQAARSGAP